MTQERSEKVFFAEGAITVTSSRITVRGDLHTMNNVASTKVRSTHLDDAKKKFMRSLGVVGSLILGFLLAVLLWAGPGLLAGLGVGLIVWVAGTVAAYRYIKPGYTLYTLDVGTTSGEQTVLVSRDLGLVRRVERAIADAIVFRG